MCVWDPAPPFWTDPNRPEVLLRNELRDSWEDCVEAAMVPLQKAGFDFVKELVPKWARPRKPSGKMMCRIQKAVNKLKTPTVKRHTLLVGFLKMRNSMRRNWLVKEKISLIQSTRIHLQRLPYDVKDWNYCCLFLAFLFLRIFGFRDLFLNTWYFLLSRR